MPVPDFRPGEVLTAAAMDSIGLWLVKTQTVGAGVSSVTVTGAFSADYDNYRIVISGVSNSATDIVSVFTLGSANTAYYSNMSIYKLGTGVINLPQNNDINAYVAIQDTNNTSTTFDLISPNLAKWTIWSGSSFGFLGQFVFAGELRDTTQFTSFTLAPASGTWTGGTIRIYGYRN